jgi:hypothetical protein
MPETNESDALHLDAIRQLRDELKVKVHLAQLDAKDRWQELETQFEDLERRVTGQGNLVGATAQLARDLKQSFLDFRDRLSA